ncbi:M16 family metallopeptidase [Myceligenerans indicum]|uniref:Insulinase family protein n=1 Tax=Myceligenerans indicum TaxID=2593663 RepID=A0ABS1LHQ8_9MICO|nr:insulinase family protein [Myceligenerans indicum]MBL0885770.1 insulinase family protein [Myceligenerans indicum]
MTGTTDAPVTTDATRPADAGGSVASPDVPDLISTGEVDGIPVLHAPWRENHVTGGLVFRVGQADETLATRGITHLVEHLALFGPDLAETRHNGVTSDITTVFHVSGTLEEVVDHLNQVCAALRDLPVHRIETEKEILRTEEAGRHGDAARTMRIERYGASTYGLPGYAELGLGRIGPSEVRDWARSRFTRDNAVLFLTTDAVPEGLDLRLPQGRRHPAPVPSSALSDGTPAFFRGAEGGAVLDAVVPRSAAASLFAQVAGRALFRDLRQAGGYSYRPDAEYAPRDAHSALITLSADALPDKQDAVVGGLVDTLARLRLGTIEPAEVEAAKERARKTYDVPDLGARMLPQACVDVLLGAPALDPQRHLAEVEATTVEDVQTVAREVWEGALLQVPARDADWAGMVPAPRWSGVSVPGTAFPAEEGRVTLRVGADGVSLVTPDGPVTVRFAETAVMIAYADGGRVLTGLDGFRVAVEPTLFRGLTPEDVFRLVDARVPAHLVVPRTRDPQRVPQPQPQPVSRPQPDLGARLLRIGNAALSVAGWVILAFLGFFVVTVAFGLLEGAVGRSLTGLWLATMVLIAGGVVAWRVIRRRRRRR